MISRVGMDRDATPWLSGRVPDGYWSRAANRRRYMDWLGKKCGFQTSEDWHHITKRTFYKNRGGGLLANYYRDSPFAAMREYKPRCEWKPWLFRSVPQGFWQSAGNRRAYMDWLGKELKCKQTSDWYRITKEDFYSHCGGGLLANYYGDSPLAALKEYRPSYPWKAWLLTSAPQRYWKRRAHRREYMEWLGKQLRVRRPEDWYKLTRKDFVRHGGGGLLVMYFAASPLKALQEYLPAYKWDSSRFQSDS